MNPSEPGPHFTDTDRPLDDPGADELGFVAIAEKLAPAVMQTLDDDGVVVGIEGVWGSGKTTLANYLLAEIRRQAGNTVEVIYLAPWLNGDGETLVGSLLQAMAAAVERRRVLGSWARRWRWLRGKRQAPLTVLLQKYAVKTARTASPLLKMGDGFVPGLSAVGTIVGAGADAVSGLSNAPTNAQLKAAIAKQLKETDCRFIVVLDDLDRLEPSQAVEVVRLVRSVADFPKMLHIMCYDRRVLAHALEIGLRVEDGYRFLRKIVQQTFSIPQPEPFDLRLTLIDKAIAFFGRVHERVPTLQEATEIRDALNEWGESLRTPRDVKLVLNGIAFAYPPVAENVYYPDICRLHVIKITHPDVYQWLETYLSEYSVVATGDGHVGRHGRLVLGKELRSLFPDTNDVSSPQSTWRIQQIVPGIDSSGRAAEDELVFRDESEQTLADFSSSMRLGSPYHYRYYFALAGPRTVLVDTEIAALLAAADDTADLTSEALRTLYDRPRRLGGSWFGQLLDRIDRPFVRGVSARQLGNLLRGIADLMDLSLHREPDGPSFRRTLAGRAQVAIRRLYQEWRGREQQGADEAMMDLLANSPSVNWIVGYFFRREMYDHGHVDPARAISEREWLLPAEVFGRALEVVRNRAAAYSQDSEFHSCPDFPNFIFGWRELGNQIVREWVTAYTQDDGGFVDFLLRMRSWAVSDHVFRPLDRQTLVDLMEIDGIDARLEAIRERETTTLRRLATEVSAALALGDRNR